MKNKKEKTPISSDDIRVTLKPIAGIKPHFYVPALYCTIILVVLFFLLFFPGIRRHGALVSFSSTPSGAAVSIDNNYAGSTPCTVFVDSGEHTFLYEKSFFSNEQWKEKVPGRLFFSLFLQKRVTLAKELNAEDINGFLVNEYKNFSKYAMLEEFFPQYQPPPLLSNAIDDYFAARRIGFDAPLQNNIINDFLLHALQNVQNDVLLRDYLDAVSTIQSGGMSLTSNSIISLVREYIITRKHYSGIDFLFLNSLPVEQKKKTVSNDLYKSLLNQRISTLKGKPEYFGSVLDAPSFGNGFNFVEVTEGFFVQGLNLDETSVSAQSVLTVHPRFRAVSSFYILEGEVTKEQYSRFLNDNPEWRVENRSTLIENNLVTADYLKNWSSIDDDSPVSYVSYHAADAFCDWLEKTLTLPKDHHVRLPMESEWEYAARQIWDEALPLFHSAGITGAISSEKSNEMTKIIQMKGNLWEWCDNWFFPSAYFLNNIDYLSDLEVSSKWPGVEKTVRGGSWANREDEITSNTRGSQPPEWCTPFLGFRPIITDKEILQSYGR